MISTEQASPTTPQRVEVRRRMRGASLMSQLTWLEKLTPADGVTESDRQSRIKRVKKQIGRLLSVVCSATWAEDARSLPADAGGEYPPCDEQGVPLMVRAKGEKVYYPRQYIVASGHSYEIYLETIYTGTSRRLHEDGIDGRPLRWADRVQIIRKMEARRRRLAELEGAQNAYVPGMLSISDMHPADRKLIRETLETTVGEGWNERKRQISNSI